MPPAAPLFNGKYRLISWNEPVQPVPPEEKGVHYALTHLTAYKEAELELKLGQLSEGFWPLKGSLRVSPSQWFSVNAWVGAGRPTDAEGILIGNKRRAAWFHARYEKGRVELSIGYRDAQQNGVPAQTFSFQATPLSQEQIMEAIAEYLSLKATKGRDLFLHLGAHSELLRDEVMESLDLLLEQATREKHPGLNQIKARCEFVVKARQAVADGTWENLLNEARRS